MTRKTRRTTRSLALTRSRATGRHRVESFVVAFGSSDPETRCLAALKLGRHGGPESVDALEQAAAGNDLELEYCARTALVQLSARLEKPKLELPPVPELKRRLTSPYPQERSGAVRMLTQAAGGDAVPVLLAALANEGDASVIALIARALGLHGAAAQREYLMRLIKHRDHLVRAAAVEALWGTEDPAVLTAVVPLLKDESPKVRGVTLVLMIRRAHATSRAMAEKVLDSQKLWMRLAALFALGSVNDPWARQTLIRHIRNVTLPRLVRALAREAIVLGGGTAPAAGPEEQANTIYTDLTRHLPSIEDEAGLKHAVESQDPLLRTHGLQNARRFAEQTVMPALLRLVRYEQDPLVQATLVKALGRIGGHGQIDTIRKFLEHADERVRSNAIEALALAQLGPELDLICKGLLVEEEAPRLQKQAAAQLFASNPQEAVAHFRGLILGEDPASRQSALAILSTIMDDRLIGVLRDALRDPRREVYAPAVTAIRRVAPNWLSARELLDLFEKGDVLGEVIDGDPVSALLFEMNSARSSDRVRAMGKLLAARDLRVETVLELNLTSRDPEVATEAARVLRERHRQYTLPRLYLKLGDEFTTRSRAGELLVPQELSDQLPELEDAGGEEPADQDRVRWIGKALYDAFEDDVEMDRELRTLCHDVRSALDQMGAIRPVPPPSQVSGAYTTAAMPMPSRAGLASMTQFGTRPERTALRAAAMAADPSSLSGTHRFDRGAEEPPPASGSSMRHAGLAGGLAIAVIAAVLSIDFTGETGVEGGGGGAAAQGGQSTKMLDAIGLESKPARFRERFRGRRLSFSAKVAGMSDVSAADLRSGTVLFRLKTPKSSPLPPGLRVGQVCEVAATILDLEADGSIQIEGSVSVTAGS